MEVLEKTQNAYNLWIEFLNKMENVKAIKEKIDGFNSLKISKKSS